MNIGIAAPIEVASLKNHFNRLSDFESSLGLGGTAVNIIIDGLLNKGHKVIVFTLDKNIKDKYVLQGNNLKIIFGHFRTSALIKTFDFCYKEFNQIKRFIKEEKTHLDVINAHWSYEFAIGSLLAMPKKTIVTFRDDAPTILKLLKHPYRISRLVMDKWVRIKAKHITYNSPYLADLIKLQGTIIPNPTYDKNITEFRLHKGDKHCFKICFVANGTDERKNPSPAFEAFKILKSRHVNVELHFIGSGYELVSEFAIQHIFNGVIYKGKLEHHVFLSLLNEYDIMLHTSKEESFGNNLIEAMAKGLPVIAGENSGAVPWVLDYGKAGILVNIENPKLIADELEKLISIPEYYNKLSKAGYKNVLNRFSQEIVCKKYIEEYKKII